MVTCHPTRAIIVRPFLAETECKPRWQCLLAQNAASTCFFSPSFACCVTLYLFIPIEQLRPSLSLTWVESH
jgi:hypothetical protein